MLFFWAHGFFIFFIADKSFLIPFVPSFIYPQKSKKDLLEYSLGQENA